MVTCPPAAVSDGDTVRITGVTTVAAVCTVNTVVAVKLPSVAVIFAVPVVMLTVNPCTPELLEILATEVSDDDQITLEVTSLVLPFP